MKRYYRYFGGFISTQEKWLNQIASNGYRLVKSENLLYQFEHSNDAYKYYVDFVADLSQQDSEAYKAFLEEMDYKVFYKNMNLCYSIGKIRYRPWAEKGGRIVTAKNNFNKELLIVEAKNDEHPIELHTCLEDRIRYFFRLAKMWGYLSVIFLALGICLHTYVGGFFAIPCLLPAVLYGNEIRRCRKEGKIYER